MKFEPYQLTKIEAVRVQLEEAIKMFFERRNSIAIHTIVGASHQVLHDLCDREKSMIKNDHAAEYSGKEGGWFKRLNKEYNFLKHAEKDNGESINFDPLLFTYYLIDCVYMYRKLTNSDPHSHRVFDVWFALANPEAIGDTEKRDLAKIVSKNSISPENYEYFLNLVLNHRNTETPILRKT